MIRKEHWILAALIVVVLAGFPLWATILPLFTERRPLPAERDGGQ